MNFLRPRIMVLLALIFGIITTFSAYKYLEKQKEQINEPVILTKPIITAAIDLPIGSLLNESNMVVSEWPNEIIPNNTFTTIQSVVGRVVKERVYAKEAIIESKLAPPGSAGGFASLIPIGMRAMTVAVNVVSGVSGFILPGTYVDVVVTANPSGSQQDPASKIILENVLVLAIDQTFEKEDNDPMTVQSVTLMVSPDDAEKLALGSTEGKLQLALRNSAENNSESLAKGVQLSEMLAKTTQQRVYRTRSRPAPQKEEVAPVTEKKVEVIRANQRSEITVNKSNP